MPYTALRTIRRRPFLLVACIVAVMAVAAGCGGGDSTTSSGGTKDEQRMLEGVFSGVRATGKTSFAGSTEGATLPISYVHVCADDDCKVVWQRALDQKTGAGSTVRLERSGDDTWKMEGARKVSCPENADRIVELEGTLTWTLAGDKLRGEGRNVVDGCGKPLAEESTWKLKADSDVEAPFLDAEDTTPLKQAITAFDAGYSKFLKREPKCVKQVGTAGQVPQGIACYQAAFKPWQAGIRGMPAALQAIAEDATGDCRAAVEAAMPLVATEGRLLAGVAKMYANDPSSRWNAVSAAEQKNFEHAHRTHVAVAEVAYFCVSPTDVEGLGSDGTLLVLDEQAALPPFGAKSDD